MPAAAVIPAPIAYIKLVEVTKLVVGSQVPAGGAASSAVNCPTSLPLPALFPRFSSLSAAGGWDVYFEKI